MMRQQLSLALAAGWLVAPALLALCGLAACSRPPAAVLSMGASSSVNWGNELNGLAANLLPQTENYTDPAGPLFRGQAAPKTRPTPDEIVVVTYNLRYGEAVDETIAAFGANESLAAADVVLLQEMDEVGVAAIAEALGFNYVYYPASVAEDGDNFGNAILARWPIREPAKLILPGLHPLTGQQRTATRAVVGLGDIDILVYSTHIEVSTAPSSMRAAQVDALLDDIPAEAPYVIVGGDFNTVTGRGVRALAAQFGADGLDHATAGLGPTYTRFGLRPSATDHLFTRGFRPLDADVLGDITASDHFPVWARLSVRLARS